MSTPSALSLRIAPKRSNLYLLFIAATHAVAAAGSLFNSLPIVIQIALLIAVVGSFVASVQRYLTGIRERRVVIAHNDSEGWSLQSIGQEVEFANLMGTSVSTRILTILHFILPNFETRWVVLFRDSLDKKEYRKLRVLMKVTNIQE